MFGNFVFFLLKQLVIEFPIKNSTQESAIMKRMKVWLFAKLHIKFIFKNLKQKTRSFNAVVCPSLNICF